MESLKKKILKKAYTKNSVYVDDVRTLLDEVTRQIQEELQKLTDILALPNMGDEGRKAKLVAIKAWEINFRKAVLEGDKP